MAQPPDFIPLHKFFTWTKEEIDAFPPLPHPANVLELVPGEEIQFRFTRREVYRFDIAPRWPGAPPLKRVIALRCWLHPEYYYRGLPWVDFTAGRLVSQLEPIFQMVDFKKAIVWIKKIGERPKAEFSVAYKLVE